MSTKIHQGLKLTITAWKSRLIQTVYYGVMSLHDDCFNSYLLLSAVEKSNLNVLEAAKWNRSLLKQKHYYAEEKCGRQVENINLLMMAAKFLNFEVMTYLINAGYDIHDLDTDGNSPAHYAARTLVVYGVLSANSLSACSKWIGFFAGQGVDIYRKNKLDQDPVSLIGTILSFEEMTTLHAEIAASMNQAAVSHTNTRRPRMRI